MYSISKKSFRCIVSTVLTWYSVQYCTHLVLCPVLTWYCVRYSPGTLISPVLPWHRVHYSPGTLSSTHLAPCPLLTWYSDQSSTPLAPCPLLTWYCVQAAARLSSVRCRPLTAELAPTRRAFRYVIDSVSVARSFMSSVGPSVSDRSSSSSNRSWVVCSAARCSCGARSAF